MTAAIALIKPTEGTAKKPVVPKKPSRGFLTDSLWLVTSLPQAASLDDFEK
jgi:hypothetical protein